MILVQKRQKFDQTTRFWRQIFQNFVQKAPNFKPKIAKTKLHFIAFLCHFEAKIHEKINFSLKINHQEIIGLTNSEKKNHFLLITHQMCFTPWYFYMFQFQSRKICENSKNPEKYANAKNARFFCKIASKISQIWRPQKPLGFCHFAP